MLQIFSRRLLYFRGKRHIRDTVSVIQAIRWLEHTGIIIIISRVSISEYLNHLAIIIAIAM